MRPNMQLQGILGVVLEDGDLPRIKIERETWVVRIVVSGDLQGSLSRMMKKISV